MKDPKIFVTGATGFIGRHLVNSLLERKQYLYILTRNPDRVPLRWKDRLSILKGDLSDTGFSLPDGTEIVFHCAGEIKDKSRFQETNVEGTRNIVNACLKHGRCKLVYLSSVGVMGADKDGLIGEGTNCSPKNIYEKTKYEAERIIQDAVRDSGLNAVILRPSIVYGPGIAKTRDSFLALIKAIKSKKFCLFGKKPSYYNIVYVGDVVEALIYLADTDIKVSGETFIINDVIPWEDFIKEVLSILKKNNAVMEIPGFIGYSLALLCEAANRVGVKTPFSLSRYRVLTCKTIFSSVKLSEQAGYRFRYGNKEGIKITLKHYLDQGLL